MKITDITKLISKLLPEKKFTKEEIANIQSGIKTNKRAMEEYKKIIQNETTSNKQTKE